MFPGPTLARRISPAEVCNIMLAAQQIQNSAKMFYSQIVNIAEVGVKKV